MSKAFIAIVETPLGVWESTAAVCTGREAEYRAKQWAKSKFAREILPPFIEKGIDTVVESVWRAATNNGCLLIGREIEIEPYRPSPAPKDGTSKSGGA